MMFGLTAFVTAIGESAKSVVALRAGGISSSPEKQRASACAAMRLVRMGADGCMIFPLS